MKTGRARRLLVATVLCVGLVSVTTAAQVVISEVAWVGTAASYTDEWIELCNVTSEPIDLAGWTLVFGDVTIHLGAAEGSTSEVRNAVIGADGFLILERMDDTTISDIEADIIYRGSLSNTGSDLVLIDAGGGIVDVLQFAETGWPAGTGSDEDLPYGTMERVDAAAAEAVWRTNDGEIRNGLDAEGGALNGTPGAVNSATIVAASAPRIELVSPSAETEFVGGVYVIEWAASDPDGLPSALAVSIYLSADGGESWEVLVENLANAGSYSWDTTGFASGGGFTLRLVVEDLDGHVGEALSVSFRIENEEG